MYNPEEGSDPTIPLGDKKKRGDAARRILLEVYNALEERGYHPQSQLAGYLMSGEPAYITSHRGARILITKIEREELIEELLRSYLEHVEREKS